MELAANLSWLYRDLDWSGRFEAAARDGFRAASLTGRWKASARPRVRVLRTAWLRPVWRGLSLRGEILRRRWTLRGKPAA